jgi:hypothetical protein
MPATGTVTINVCGKVYFGDQTGITGLAAGSDALRLQVYSAYATVDTTSCSAAGICLGDGGASETLYGVFRAPNAGIRLAQGTTLYGFVQGAAVYTEAQSTVNGSGVTGSACITAGLGSAAASTAPSCPVVTATATRRHEEGICTTNAINFTDTTGCATKFDLAMNFPCDNQVQVCNHGGVTAPAGAVVTLYPRSGQQFAPNSPDPAWALDTCTVTSTIAAGQCATATCNAAWFTGASSQDLTMMVNVAGTTPANECSLLDNWSLFDKTRTCSVATPTDEVQVYEARCPYVDVDGVSRGTSPRWGSLSWDSATPGSSEITWEGRVAKTSTGFAGAYESLGLANAASGNAVCEKDTMITGCPVKLTTQLGVGQSLPTTCDSTGCSSFLQVRAHLTPAGTSAPTLRDWEVTYSCVFDE